MKRAYLALSDGTIFEGESFGFEGETEGECVFNTSLTGYQEILTDPSYCRQIVILTYPMIGNTGVNREDWESLKPQVAGLIVKEYCATPSNWRSTQSLADYLIENKIVAVEGLPTREIVRHIQELSKNSGLEIEDRIHLYVQADAPSLRQALESHQAYICGETLATTVLNDAASAEEALCVSINGNKKLQLARQLTAAALNCVVTSGSPTCDGLPIAADLQLCNAECAGGPAAGFDCVAAIDCVNNGGMFDKDTGFCETGSCSDNARPCNAGNRSQCDNPATATCVPTPGNCHDQVLCNTNTHLCFDPPGPAGSDNKCNNAIANACDIIGTGEAACATDSRP